MSKIETVTVKIQRPLVTNGNPAEVMSYIVDDEDEQLSNPAIVVMSPDEIEQIFGDHYKVYYRGKYRHGHPVKITKPTRKDEWV